jgi:AhpD family alkylhydroperoxidase
MARLPAVTVGAAGVMVKLVYWFTERRLQRLTGTNPSNMLEPLEIYAHIPRLLSAYGQLEWAVASLHHLRRRHRALAELRAATVVQCEFCIDLGSQVARRWGLSDDELLALPHYPTSPLFSAVDRLVLDYATGMSRTPVQISDELFTALRQHFTVPQLVELTSVIALEQMRGRFNLALDIGPAGFSDGMICALPQTIT